MYPTPINIGNRLRAIGQELMKVVLIIGLLWAGNQVFQQRRNSVISNQNSPESVLADWQSQALSWRTSWQTQINSVVAFNQLNDKNDWLANESIQSQTPIYEEVQNYLSQQESRWQALAEENQTLREALNLTNSEASKSNRLAAPILSLTQRLIELPVEVKPTNGQTVMGKSSLLGWIDQNQGQRATVTLLKDAVNSRLVGRTLNGASGLVINRKGNLYLTEVPTQFEVKPGDVVVTETQLLSPAGLVIGRVQSVTTDESGTIQTALLVPIEYFGEETVVWIGK